MKRIVLATDLSIRSSRAVKRANQLAQENAASLTSITFVPGEPFEAILGLARDVSADLIVAGFHRKGTLRDVFIGTAMERVVRAANVPVLVVNAEPVGSYARCLIPVDLSESSASAIRLARRLRLLDAGHATVLHVYDDAANGLLRYASMPRAKVKQRLDIAASEASARLDSFLRAAGFGELRTRVVREGHVAREILSIAARAKCDLIVLATYTRGAVARFLLGSVSKEVLTRASCDVLVIPPAMKRPFSLRRGLRSSVRARI